MWSNLSCYQVKTDCYLHRVYVSFIVVTRKKKILIIHIEKNMRKEHNAKKTTKPKGREKEKKEQT